MSDNENFIRFNSLSKSKFKLLSNSKDVNYFVFLYYWINETMEINDTIEVLKKHGFNDAKIDSYRTRLENDLT